MKTLTLDVPAMYGDHHVTEVRRVLMEMDGVDDVYASSGFRVVEVTYDPKKVKEDAITAKLGEAGYLEDLTVPVEVGAVSESQNGQEVFFRHTAAYEQTSSVVGFAQNVSYTGRPLWPCPGLGVINVDMDE